ncbi:hypothetical protein AYX07_06090 [Thermoactinomyces sp. AS95]|nr:hypothetical protein JS81_11020 [Thermoactinomyces sp. Gus2-1]KYQ86716.1 hypothetical protein AYX07_06090 [Thermoactinomyces sp. AS95]
MTRWWLKEKSLVLYLEEEIKCVNIFLSLISWFDSWLRPIKFSVESQGEIAYNHRLTGLKLHKMLVNKRMGSEDWRWIAGEHKR